MPRPKKSVNYEEEINRIDMQITRWKKTIKELEEEKEKLVREKRDAELTVLYQAVQASGKTMDEIVAILQSGSPTFSADQAS